MFEILCTFSGVFVLAKYYATHVTGFGTLNAPQTTLIIELLYVSFLQEITEFSALSRSIFLILTGL